jgi:hypothetical protein
VIPNAYWGIGLSWEADLIIVSARRFLTEVEVKVSRADFIADAAKDKHRLTDSRRIKSFYYAMPAEVWESSKDVWRAPGAGVITVAEDTAKYKLGFDVVKFEIPAHQRRDAEPMADHHFAKLGNLMSLRYWAQFQNQKSGIPPVEENT